MHDKIIGQQESSTLHIQNYSLLKYIQKPEEIISIETYSQGSIRFVLPKGRNVLRLELAARNGINTRFSLVDKTDQWQSKDIHPFSDIYQQLIL